MGFTTGWGNFAGLQGYQRAYFLYFEGQYFTPFIMNVGLAYDYNPSIVQEVQVIPQSPNLPYGGDPVFGASAVFGGSNNGVFEARVFLQKQRAESFQVTVQEQYDSSYGVPAGQGFNLSGMTAIVGLKKGYRTQSASKSFG
jgi:multidrug efflux pump subunit AcrA (membrane-fusion protein)